MVFTGDQRTALGSLLSPSTFLVVLGDRTQVARFAQTEPSQQGLHLIFTRSSLSPPCPYFVIPVK